MSDRRRSASAALPVLRGGTHLLVYAVVEAHRPLGGPALRPVGQAVINPDCTITAWLDALPTSGTLVLRTGAVPAPLEPEVSASAAAVVVYSVPDRRLPLC